MFVACWVISSTLVQGHNTDTLEKMIQSNASYRSYDVDEQARAGENRLPPGPALLAAVGLSLLGWAFVLVPLVAILHQ
jgi:hypothetical protein